MTVYAIGVAYSFRDMEPDEEALFRDGPPAPTQLLRGLPLRLRASVLYGDIREALIEGRAVTVDGFDSWDRLHFRSIVCGWNCFAADVAVSAVAAPDPRYTFIGMVPKKKGDGHDPS